MTPYMWSALYSPYYRMVK